MQILIFKWNVVTWGDDVFETVKIDATINIEGITNIVINEIEKAMGWKYEQIHSWGLISVSFNTTTVCISL